MSLSITAFSSNSVGYDAGSAPKPAPKQSETEQIRQLASQGHSATAIAATLGISETVVTEDLGSTTTTTSSATSQASALLALGARLSVSA